MYTTTRNIAGGTFMTCKVCGHAISMNKICDQPIQSATEILKHMAAHKASALAAGSHVTPELEAVRAPREAWLPSQLNDLTPRQAHADALTSAQPPNGTGR
jgi:hypothetical protein